MADARSRGQGGGSSRGYLGCCWLTTPLLLLLCSLSVAMPQENPILCINNCGFYGRSATNNLCSKCYKDFITPVVEKKATPGASSSTAAPKPPASNRCLTCGKKVGLTGFQCRCGGTFCSVHRYADSHQCTFDYKTADREKIAKQNPVVMADKINKI